MNWNNPEVIDEKQEDGVRDMNTASVNYEPEIDAYMKQQAKERRQQLKLSCLEISFRGAIATGDLTSKNIVEAAKAFYAFVRT